MRHVLLCALVAAGCGNSSGLGAKDVELTINTRANAINDQDLATVTALELTLSGSQADHTRYDLSRPLKRAETLVVHLTKATGDLTIAALARDAQGLVVALGYQKSTLSGSDPHVIDVDLEAPPSGTHAPSAVSITPSPSVQVFGNQSVTLTASSAVDWSVAAGGAGGTIADTTTTAMTSYKAPGGTGGSDQVIASSPIYYGEKASLSVDVLATGVLRYAGLTGGAGTVDGTGSAVRIAYPRGIAGDSAGNVYFSEPGSNVIRKLDTSGKVTTIAGTVESNLFADGTGSAAGFAFPWGVAWDEARHVLYVADQRTVRKVDVTSGAVTTLAGADNMAGIMDGTGSAAQFWNIWGAAYGNNHLYVAEVNGNCIRDVDVTTGAVTTIVGSAFMAGYVDGAGSTARLSFPTSLALNGNTLYIGDSQNSLIRAVDLGTKMVSTLTGKQGVSGSTDGAKGTATLSYPDQLTYDGAGSLYMANGRRIDVSNGTITTNLTPGIENYPIQSLAFTPDGKLWLGSNSALGTINPANWQTTVVAGVKMSFNDYGSVDGSRWEAKFGDPIGIAAAPDGTFIVQEGSGLSRIDPTTDTIKKIFPAPAYLGSGGNVTVAADGTIYMVANSAVFSLLPSENYSQMHQIAGTGGFGYKDGAAAQAIFGNPNDLALVGKVLYVADTGNNVIRAVDLNAGMVSTLAGTANMGGLVDMPGAAARFNSPQGIVSDGAGNLYVASNNAVRKIVIAGAVVSTVAGGDAPGTGDGTGGAAKFNLPVHLILDAQKQNLFVSDQKGTAIRKVTLPGGVVTTVAGMPGKAVLAPGPLATATLNEPGALALMPSGDLLVVVNHEQSLVEIRLP